MANSAAWKTYLEGYSPCNFPALGTGRSSGTGLASVSTVLKHGHDKLQSFSNLHSIDDVAAVLCAAWGLVLRAYTGQDTVCFGKASKKIDACRIDFASTTSILSILQTLQIAGDSQPRAQETSGSQLPLNAADSVTSFFNTCVLCRNEERPDQEENDVPGTAADTLDLFGIVVTFGVEQNVTSITLRYQTSLLDEAQAISVANTLEQAICEIIHNKDQVDGICLLSDAEKARIYSWNEKLPQHTNHRVDKLITDQCQRSPSAMAVCAWDGELSYEELDNVSSRLAQHLKALGVCSEVFVPICFEKSRWAIVAMLGVIKAGGAFVLLDASHPHQRLFDICNKISAKLIVSSTQNAKLAAGLAPSVVELGSDDCERSWRTDVIHGPDSFATPDCALYAVFTSGTTGTPKGVVSEHSSFLAATQTYIDALRLNRESRTFQFASYAFDVTIFDTLMTLTVGGCVCVPSDTERSNDLAKAVQHFRATHISLTPTIARILDPQDFPTMRTLTLGGEKLQTSEISKWVSHARVVHLYGATECSMIAVQSITGTSSDLRTTNCPTGHSCWVVDPADHDKLQAIGAIGELVVEGSIVSRGYLHDPIQTAETFIQPPAWLRELRGTNDQRCKVYKSGDLVRHGANGSIEFICRKNTQVKLRGQRIELGEVEHHLKLAFPGANFVVAELITVPDASRPPILMAFVRLGEDFGPGSITGSRGAASANIIAEPTDEFRSRVPAALSKLQDCLPSYMVPAAVIPLTVVPLTGTDKVDRKLLRRLGADLSRQQLERYQPTARTYRVPTTNVEKTLRKYFAEVLNLPEEQIWADDHFFALGGDSLTAMRLVSLARKGGYSFTVQNVFHRPQLSELASLMQTLKSQDDKKPQPFALVGKNQNVVRAAAQQCHLPTTAIEDLYPCTWLQKGLMSETMREPGAFIAKLELPLGRHIDVSRLEEAWTAVAKANPILRTRMVLSSSYGLLQAVVRDSVSWMASDNGECGDLPVAFGKPLVKVVLCRAAIRQATQTKLVLMMHHSVYDGYTLPLIIAQWKTAYDGHVLAPRPVSPFIRYLTSLPSGADYWISLLKDIRAPAFPALPSKTYNPVPDSTETYTSAVPKPVVKTYTSNTYVRLAWALTQCYHQQLTDVFFGTVVSGRNAPVDDIDLMTMPTVATIPCRVAPDTGRVVADMLDGIQNVASDGIPHEQFGLANISRLGEGPARACSFQTLLVMQPAAEGSTDDGFVEIPRSDANYRADATYAVNLFCELEAGRLAVTVLYDENVVPRLGMQRILADFGLALGTILQTPGSHVGDVLAILKQSRE
ncbi:peptide synthetase [Metarhizium album ARSEF 1941]|uniref:Peptide synthetase n=1 Tax=Metarhizium album (strain ARSEF 1941) TaxID=1081103 RepID=A0A0B2WTW6_METAS|nr:peptide synthetase [Metarhizium album ARSEF 1941]KHN97498.1 peptide synthetase [Metarhizium album ARSEF 1941]